MSDNGGHQVAYLLMVHKNPRQVRRLVDRLNYKTCAFWVHVDVKQDIHPFRRELEQLPNVFFVENRKDCSWGRFSFTEANIEGIKAIHQSGYLYDHLVILSGQDYPLCSNDLWLATLSANKGASLVHFQQVTDHVNPHTRERVLKYHIPFPGNKMIIYPYSSGHVTKRAINLLLRASRKYPLPRILPRNRDLYFGSNWIRLAPKAVSYFLETLEAEPEICRFFSTTSLSEEHLFHTILLSGTETERGKIINNNFTFCHWKRDPSLYTIPLNMSDVDLLFSSNDLMARKFDETYDVEILNYLDKNFL